MWVTAHDEPLHPEEITGTPLQVEKKRRKWLQLHDQKTAGIPGLLPLYLGMKARVTEKVSMRLQILKHCPCTVIGWDLGLADDIAAVSEGERVLKEHPRCIYVQFEGAAWKIHELLEPGVFPLKAVARNWVLNKETGVKIRRRGFTLLPDYASTAHMVQGMTCDAVIADGGSATDNVSIKDMLATYVALTRVRKASTLLLLRMFSRHLFQQGPPPGPHCLMKLLRARLHPAGQADRYTLDDAVAEYARLEEAQQGRRSELRDQIDTWQCFACESKFAAELFDVEVSATTPAVACIAPGHWLICRACAVTHRSDKTVESLSAYRRCGSCREEKRGWCFAPCSD